MYAIVNEIGKGVCKIYDRRTLMKDELKDRDTKTRKVRNGQNIYLTENNMFVGKAVIFAFNLIYNR